MKVKLILLAFLVFFFLENNAKAQVPTIKITSTDNSQAGQLTVSGSYTIPANWSLGFIFVYVRPSGTSAGQGGFKSSKVDTNKLTFSGTITNAPSGTYDVFATISADDPNNTYRIFFSTTLSKQTIK